MNVERGGGRGLGFIRLLTSVASTNKSRRREPELADRPDFQTPVLLSSQYCQSKYFHPPTTYPGLSQVLRT